MDTPPAKRSRSARVTENQVIAMLDVLESNRSLATGKSPGIKGRDAVRKKWAELSVHLNAMKGAQKNSAQWQVTWRDLKSRTLIKMRNLQSDRAAARNKQISETDITVIDKRVIGLIDNTYVEGSEDCPDSPPEEHANAMVILADAMKMQAEASLVAAKAAQQQADAAVKQAANDAARIEVFKQLTEVLSQLLPHYAT